MKNETYIVNKGREWHTVTFAKDEWDCESLMICCEVVGTNLDLERVGLDYYVCNKRGGGGGDLSLFWVHTLSRLSDQWLIASVWEQNRTKRWYEME